MAAQTNPYRFSFVSNGLTTVPDDILPTVPFLLAWKQAV